MQRVFTKNDDNYQFVYEFDWFVLSIGLGCRLVKQLNNSYVTITTIDNYSTGEDFDFINKFMEGKNRQMANCAGTTKFWRG
jgi:hypothetical protein